MVYYAFLGLKMAENEMTQQKYMTMKTVKTRFRFFMWLSEIPSFLFLLLCIIFSRSIVFTSLSFPWERIGSILWGELVHS